MLGRIARTWPRLLVGMALLTLFLALAWATGVAEIPVQDSDLDGTAGSAVFALALFIVVFGLIAATVTVLAAVGPSLLGLVETLLLALILAIPFSLAREALGAPTWVDFFAIAAFFMAAYQVLFGSWLTGIGRRDTRTHRSRFVVPDPVETVWARIVPLPENAATYYWPKADFMAAPEGSDADFVLHGPRRKGLAPAIEAFRIEALEPGRAVTLRSAPLPGGHGVKERQTIRLSPEGTRTRVELEVTFLDVPVGHRIRLWLNNDAADFAASLRNRARGRRDGSVHGRQVLPA